VCSYLGCARGCVSRAWLCITKLTMRLCVAALHALSTERTKVSRHPAWHTSAHKCSSCAVLACVLHVVTSTASARQRAVTVLFCYCTLWLSHSLQEAALPLIVVYACLLCDCVHACIGKC
jgi:hypothetical protein